MSQSAMNQSAKSQSAKSQSSISQESAKSQPRVSQESAKSQPKIIPFGAQALVVLVVSYINKSINQQFRPKIHGSVSCVDYRSRGIPPINEYELMESAVKSQIFWRQNINDILIFPSEIFHCFMHTLNRAIKAFLGCCVIDGEMIHRRHSPLMDHREDRGVHTWP